MKEDIAKHEDKIYGDKGLSETIVLINEKLSAISNRQTINRGWAMLIISVFGISVLGLVITGISDHNTIKTLPVTMESFKDNFVTRENFMKSLKDQSELSIYLKNDVDNLKSKNELINKQLEKVDRNFDYLRITRGLPADYKLPKTLLPGGKDPDKIYNESLNKTK